MDQPRRRRRAVGPAGARPPQDEPVPDRDERPERDPQAELDRYLAERPPHHEPR